MALLWSQIFLVWVSIVAVFAVCGIASGALADAGYGTPTAARCGELAGEYCAAVFFAFVTYGALRWFGYTAGQSAVMVLIYESLESATWLLRNRKNST